MPSTFCEAVVLLSGLRVLCTYVLLTANGGSSADILKQGLFCGFPPWAEPSPCFQQNKHLRKHRLCSGPRALRWEYINGPDSLTSISSSNGAYTNFIPQNFWHELYFRILSFVYTLSPFQHLFSEWFPFPRSNPHHNTIGFSKSDLKSGPSWFCLNPSRCGEKAGSHSPCHLVFPYHTLLPRVRSMEADSEHSHKASFRCLM